MLAMYDCRPHIWVTVLLVAHTGSGNQIKGHDALAEPATLARSKAEPTAPRAALAPHKVVTKCRAMVPVFSIFKRVK